VRSQKVLETEPERESMPARARASVLDLVGNTPLVRINRVTDGISGGVEIYAKLEGFNPGGSVKDRPALEMIEAGADRIGTSSGIDILREF